MARPQWAEQYLSSIGRSPNAQVKDQITFLGNKSGLGRNGDVRRGAPIPTSRGNVYPPMTILHDVSQDDMDCARIGGSRGVEVDEQPLPKPEASPEIAIDIDLGGGPGTMTSGSNNFGASTTSSPAIIQYTGAGDNGTIEANKPVDMMKTNQGPKMIHEGELKIVGPDGSLTVIPAKMLPQEVLMLIEKRSGIKGYATGTPDVINSRSGTPSTINTKQIPPPMTGEATNTVPKIVTTPPVTIAPQPASMSGNVGEKMSPVAKPAPTSAVPTFSDKERMSKETGMPTFAINDVMLSSWLAKGREGLSANNMSQFSSGTTQKPGTTTGASPEAVPFIAGAGTRLPDGSTIQTQSRTTPTSAVPTFSDKERMSKETGMPTFAINDVMLSSWLAKGREGLSANNMSQFSSGTTQKPGTTTTDNGEFAPINLSSRSGAPLQDPNAKNIGTGAGGPGAPAPALTTAGGLTTDALQRIQDIMNGTSQVDRTILNQYMQKYDSSSASGLRAMMQRMASDPDMTAGAKNAMLAGMMRDIGIGKSNMLGTLAISSQTRADAAARDLFTFGRQIVTAEENKQKDAYTAAVNAGDFDTASTVYQQMTGKKLDTTKWKQDREYELVGRAKSNFTDLLNYTDLTTPEGLASAKAAWATAYPGTPPPSFKDLSLRQQNIRATEIYTGVGTMIASGADDAAILAAYGSQGLTADTLRSMRTKKAGEVDLDAQIGLWATDPSKTLDNALADPVLKEAVGRWLMDHGMPSTPETIASQIALRYNNIKSGVGGVVNPTSRIQGLFAGGKSFTEIKADTQLRKSIARQFGFVDDGGKGSDSISSEIDNIWNEYTGSQMNRDIWNDQAIDSMGTIVNNMPPGSTQNDIVTALTSDATIRKYMAMSLGIDPTSAAAQPNDGRTDKVSNAIKNAYGVTQRSPAINIWNTLKDNIKGTALSDTPDSFGIKAIEDIIAGGGGLKADGTFDYENIVVPWNDPRSFFHYTDFNGTDVVYNEDGQPIGISPTTKVSGVQVEGKDITFGQMETAWTQYIKDPDSTPEKYLVKGVFNAKKFADEHADLLGGTKPTATTWMTNSQWQKSDLYDNADALVVKSLPQTEATDGSGKIVFDEEAFGNLQDENQYAVVLNVNRDANKMRYIWAQFDREYGKGDGSMSEADFTTKLQSGKFTISSDGTVLNFTQPDKYPINATGRIQGVVSELDKKWTEVKSLIASQPRQNIGVGAQTKPTLLTENPWLNLSGGLISGSAGKPVSLGNLTFITTTEKGTPVVAQKDPLFYNSKYDKRQKPIANKVKIDGKDFWLYARLIDKGKTILYAFAPADGVGLTQYVRVDNGGTVTQFNGGSRVGQYDGGVTPDNVVYPTAQS